MPFIGVAVVKQISDNLVRITGLSVDAGAAGTIGLFEAVPAPDVRLPAGFQPRPYDRPDGAPVVSLQDSVQITWNPVGQQATVPPLEIDKTGTTPVDFLISIDMAGVIPDPPLPPPNSGAIEIYIRFH
jgi:hypothetical protein